MNTKKYIIYFSGQILDEKNHEDVQASLAARLKTTIDKLDRYFSGEKLVIRRNIDYQTALHIRDGFLKSGAVCLIEEVQPDDGLDVLSLSSIPSSIELDSPSVEELISEMQVIPSIDIIEGRVSKKFSPQSIILGSITILVRVAWSASIGIIFFSVGLLLFLVIDIFAPKSDRSYKILTNTYKWGSCYWFKQLKLETEDYNIDVKKTRRVSSM